MSVGLQAGFSTFLIPLWVSFRIKQVYKKDYSYPHPSVSYCWPIFCQSQHVQIHFVFPSSTDAESKSFGSFLHVHSEIIKILWGWGENGINKCLISKKLLWSVPLFSFLIQCVPNDIVSWEVIWLHSSAKCKTKSKGWSRSEHSLLGHWKNCCVACLLWSSSVYLANM